MNLHQLLQETNWKDVQECLFQYCQEDSILYESLYYELKNKMLEKNTEEITIEIEFISDEEFYDVYGKRQDDKNKYSLSLSGWNEWLHYTISDSTLQNFQKDEIVTHCLWEMTFYGLQETDILSKKEELSYASDKIDKKEYVEEISICPFCNGTKTKGENEFCLLCDDDGNMKVISFK